MAQPTYDTRDLLAGIPEFYFWEDAVTEAAAFAKAGELISAGKAHRITRQVNRLPKMLPDRSIGGLTKQGSTTRSVEWGYSLTGMTMDWWIALLAFFGTEGTPLTQAALSASAGDAIDFTAAAGKTGQYVPILKSGKIVEGITSLTFTGGTFTEGTHWELHADSGMIKLLQDYSAAAVTPQITAPEIDSAHKLYARAILPLTKVERKGIGRLVTWDDDDDNPRVLDDRGFGCVLSIDGDIDVNSENFAEISLMIEKTTPKGTVYRRT